MPERDVVTTRRAGLLHDLGRTGISNAIWDKPEPLTESERERVRLHAYYTERMLRRPAALAGLAAIAAAHHERLDGSGYHRAIRGSDIPLLGAVPRRRPTSTTRCWRTARTARRTTGRRPPSVLRAEVRAGRLDARRRGRHPGRCRATAGPVRRPRRPA